MLLRSPRTAPYPRTNDVHRFHENLTWKHSQGTPQRSLFRGASPTTPCCASTPARRIEYTGTGRFVVSASPRFRRPPHVPRGKKDHKLRTSIFSYRVSRLSSPFVTSDHSRQVILTHLRIAKPTFCLFPSGESKRSSYGRRSFRTLELQRVTIVGVHESQLSRHKSSTNKQQRRLPSYQNPVTPRRSRNSCPAPWVSLVVVVNRKDDRFLFFLNTRKSITSRYMTSISCHASRARVIASARRNFSRRWPKFELSPGRLKSTNVMARRRLSLSRMTSTSSK